MDRGYTDERSLDLSENSAEDADKVSDICIPDARERNRV